MVICELLPFTTLKVSTLTSSRGKNASYAAFPVVPRIHHLQKTAEKKEPTLSCGLQLHILSRRNSFPVYIVRVQNVPTRKPASKLITVQEHLAKFSLWLAKKWLDANNPQSSLWSCAGHTLLPGLPPPGPPRENNGVLSAPGGVSTSKAQWPFLSQLQGVCGWKKKCIHLVRARNIC